MGSDGDTSWQLAVVFGAVLFLGALYVMMGGKPEEKPKASAKAAPDPAKEKAPAKAKAKKEASAKAVTAPAKEPVPTAKEPVPTAKPAPAAKPAPKPAETKKASKATSQPAAPSPSASPMNLAAAAPEISSSGSEIKLKKPKETPEQKDARLKRQEAAKVVKKESESSARSIPAEDEWEVVVDKKKDRPKKKVEEPAPAAAAPPAPKPVVAAPVKETKTVTIDSKRIGGIIGPKGVTLHQIEDSTGTTIQIPRSDPERPVPTVSIAVTGPAAGVAKAIAVLTEIASTGTSPTLLGFDPTPAVAPVSAATESAPAPAPVPKIDVSTLAVKVESKKMGAIIGPKGATLHAIQDATETEINTTTAPKAEITSVVITGSAAGVAKAGKAINELATKGYCMLLSGEGFQESHIHVPPRFLAEIIGKSGSTIRAIQDNTGARVVIPPSAPRPGDRAADVDAPVKVILAGPKEGIAKAKEIITQITELYYHPITHPGVVHVNLDVPEKYFNFIIGTRGSEIKHIQNNFKVSVKIPDRTTVFQSVLVIGEHANCDAAVRYINKLITQVDAREQERAEDQWGGKDGEESYDEELMNRYVYSRQNKNRDDETPPAADPVPEAASVRPRPISERPPGFSPIGKGEDPDGDDKDHGAVPLNWGPVKSTMTW